MQDLPLSVAVDLAPLDRYIQSDRMAEAGMGLSALDGFLAGIAAGPEHIPPEEWLPVIWAGTDPHFAGEDEARTVLAAIMGRFNEITAWFETDPESFDPIYAEDEVGSLVVDDWVAGFFDAMALRSGAWEPLAADPEARLALMPMLLFLPNEQLREDLGHVLDDDDEALDAAAGLLPSCAVAIHDFWRMRRLRQ